jgi:hypothetical protein
MSSRTFGPKPDFIAADRSLLVMSEVSAGVSNGGSDKFGGIAMDSLITAAARALAAGDPLGALNRVALRGDAPGAISFERKRTRYRLFPHLW